MSDDLVIVCFVFVFFNKVSCTGKCDLTDIFFNFICGHTKTVIDEFQGLFFWIDNDLDFLFIISRDLLLAHHL